MRRAARTDQNHVEVVRALERFGCSVLQLHGVGSGCPDLLVSFGEAMTLVEVKTTTGKLTAQQKEFAESWPPGFIIVTDESDCFAVAEMLEIHDQRLKVNPKELN